MFQESIEDTERAPDLESSRSFERDWEGGKKGRAGFGQIKGMSPNPGSTLEGFRRDLSN